MTSKTYDGSEHIFYNENGTDVYLRPKRGQTLHVEGTSTGNNPAGSNTQVQFNDSGVLGADSTFTFNKTTDKLTVKNLEINTGNITGVASDTQVIYNSSGSLVGSNNLTFDGTTLSSSFNGNLSGTVTSDSITAAGLNTQIIYNNAGVLGGSTKLTFNESVVFANANIALTGELQGSTDTNATFYNEIFRGTAPQELITTQTSELSAMGTDVAMAKSVNYSCFACPKTGGLGGLSMWSESAGTFNQYTTDILSFLDYTDDSNTKFCSINETATIACLSIGSSTTGLSTFTRSGAVWTHIIDNPYILSVRQSADLRLVYDSASNFSVQSWNGSNWSTTQTLMTNSLPEDTGLDYPMAFDGIKLAFYYSGLVYCYTYTSSWTLTETIAVTALSLDLYAGTLAIVVSGSVRIYENYTFVNAVTIANAAHCCTNGTYVFVNNSSGTISIIQRVTGVWTASVNTTALTNGKKMSCNSTFLAVGCPLSGANGKCYIYTIVPYSNSPVVVSSIDLVGTSNKIQVYSSSGFDFMPSTIVNILDTTESTNSSTGCLKLSGGIGVAKNAFIEGSLNVVNTTESTSYITGSTLVSGGLGVTKQIFTNSGLSHQNTCSSCTSSGTFNDGTPGVPTSANTILDATYWGSNTITGESGIGAITYSNGRWTFNKSGIYSISGFVNFVTNANGSRSVSILVNGTTTIAYQNDYVVTLDRTGISFNSTRRFNSSDYVEINIFQTSGIKLNMDVIIPGVIDICRLG